MERLFELIFETPTTWLFHHMMKIAKNKTYKKSARYADIEDARRRNGSPRAMALSLNDDHPDALLVSLDTFSEQHDLIYQHNRWLQFFFGLMHFAKKPGEFVAKRKARRMRAKLGYDYRALWNFNGWHSEIVIQLLTKLRDDGHSHPVNLTTDKWAAIITEMIEGFQAHLEIGEIDFRDEDWKEQEAALRKKFERGMRLFTKWYDHLWD